MKLKSRMRLTYFLVFVIPILATVLVIVGFMYRGVGRISRQYDMDSPDYMMLLDPTSVDGNMAAAVTDEISRTVDEDPYRMRDMDYLGSLNERLEEFSSYLVVSSGSEHLYDGLPVDRTAEASDEENSDYITESELYHIQQLNFEFSDGVRGHVQIYTDLSSLIEYSQHILVEIIITAIIIFGISSAFAIQWLYRSIANPLCKLKEAADNIADGNLNVTVTAEADDEIGELCNAFEQMRLNLRRQVERNMQYEKDSKELISNISHDLKTPLTSIKGYVEGIMDGVADTKEKQDRYIRTIYNKVNDMNSLIEELTLYAKLDNNAVAYQFVRISANAYFGDCAEEISLDLEAQGVDFGYYNYVDDGTMIIVDPEQLKRVINNIIGNSIKYAEPSRKLQISLRTTEEAEFVRVEIEDNGRGIAKNELPLIFERSYRTDASRNSSAGGSGLGLSIAKKIIEEHGGKIWASSREGQGTTILFVLRKYKENEENEQDTDY